MIRHNCASSVLCNPLLLALESIIFFIRINGAVVPSSFITCGAFGATLLLYFTTCLLVPPAWSLLINIPLLAVGWLPIDRRFYFSSLNGTLAVSGISK